VQAMAPPGSNPRVLGPSSKPGPPWWGNLKLTPTQASQLRECARAGEKKTALATEYLISRETLYACLRAGSAA